MQISLKNATKKKSRPSGVNKFGEKTPKPIDSSTRAPHRKKMLKFRDFKNMPIQNPLITTLNNISDPKKTASSTHTSLLEKNFVDSAILRNDKSAT